MEMLDGNFGEVACNDVAKTHDHSWTETKILDVV
jgi:hypothetical protein